MAMLEEFGFFIEDGFTEDFTIPAAPGLHPALHGKFRPALAKERYQWLMGDRNDLDGAARADRAAEILAGHVEAWDAKSRDGKAVSPKNADMMKRLHPSLQGKLLDMVLGYAAVQRTESTAKNS